MNQRRRFRRAKELRDCDLPLANLSVFDHVRSTIIKRASLWQLEPGCALFGVELSSKKLFWAKVGVCFDIHGELLLCFSNNSC